MSNIEEMEKAIKQFGISINNHEGWRLSGILEKMFNSLKNLHEENTKLQCEVAKHSEYIKNLKKELRR